MNSLVAVLVLVAVGRIDAPPPTAPRATTAEAPADREPAAATPTATATSVDDASARLQRLELSDLAIDDELRGALRIGGASAAALGAVSLIAGVTPALLYGAKKSELGDASARFSGAADEVDGAAQLHAEALDARRGYNDVGRLAALVGLGVAAAGGAVLGVSFLLPPLPAAGDADDDGGAAP